MAKNVAVLGLDDFNAAYLASMPAAADIAFHCALTRDETMVHDAAYPYDARLDLARRRMEAIPGGVDGLITWWDFPASSMAPLLARDLGLPYAGPDSVMKCEHKLWSRLEQAEAVAPPAFCAFDPFADDPLAAITLDYPFWVKPVVGHSSMLGFEISGPEDFGPALREIRAHIQELTRPFRSALAHVALPEPLASQQATLCIAEELISGGDQFTLEAYVRNGEVIVYGIVQSVRTDNHHTFSRYQYPARLDAAPAAEMIRQTRAVMGRFGFDGSPFNAEFFYDADNGRVSLLEVNSRLSQSHADLFLKVDGQPHFQIAADLALGREPRWRSGAGTFATAAKFFLRHYENARITKVPGPAAIARMEREMPDVRLSLDVAPGMVLAELEEQESYSYELGDLFIGGRDEAELLAKFDRCREILAFDFEPV